MNFNVPISRKIRHQSHVLLVFFMGYIILYLPSDDVLRASSACVCFFGFKSVATTDFRTSELLGVPGWGTYLRVWVSKGSHRVVSGRKFTCSLQGKCSMIDTSDIVILSHIKRGIWIFIGIHTKKVQPTDHPWRVKSQPEIHWINGTYCWWFRNPAKPCKYWDKLPTSTGDRWMMVHPSQRSHRLNAHEHPMGHLGWKERWVGRWMDFLELF